MPPTPLSTPQPKAHVHSAQEELREERAEIAIYTWIEVFAVAVGDGWTRKRAQRIRLDEEPKSAWPAN